MVSHTIYGKRCAQTHTTFSNAVRLVEQGGQHRAYKGIADAAIRKSRNARLRSASRVARLNYFHSSPKIISGDTFSPFTKGKTIICPYHTDPLLIFTEHFRNWQCCSMLHTYCTHLLQLSGTAKRPPCCKTTF